MKSKLVKNLSANTLQLIVNQLFGLVIFYVLSTGLDKNSFGHINLALALLLAIFNILSFGIDQVVVRKVAAGDDPQKILSLYICHVLITGFAFYGLLLLGKSLFPSVANAYNLVLLIGIGKLMIYFSTPFKQTAIGMERFRLLASISVVSNIARACSLLTLAFLHNISIQVVVILFIGGDLLELLTGLYLFKRITKLPHVVQWNKVAYVALIKESLPQLGVVIITSALARFDWIFIGIVVSAVSLAEYSFAYKIFEISTLPLLAVAPLLIPWFTRMFKNGELDIPSLKLLIRVEMIVAALTIVVLNICWSPLIDRFTAGKYGAVNERTIFILSLCIPLLYFANFLWTINFAQGKLKLILTAFVITFSVNVLCDIILIPLYKNEGAAIGYLMGYTAQTIYFILKNDVKDLNKVLYPIFICTACACASVFFARMLLANAWVEIAFSVFIYAILLLLTLQVKWSDRMTLQRMIKS